MKQAISVESNVGTMGFLPALPLSCVISLHRWREGYNPNWTDEDLWGIKLRKAQDMLAHRGKD